ncbi:MULTISPECIES: 16S rRNA (cytosine(1402)-N(4))-methyltransferase RsmH [Lentibacter]|jgi:16S rRNA (cytosine1402-N4)-methyltransferase|uniref:Ribosomal RNA small subunit methyltransferase H n=2 Tax=Lentibacter algarum TaxID=576131 RepID=A0A1H3I5I4_9RHOB|nr:16S rRNA (cytosine(1402)-N(4))-methyltransferase RsmH [Lentibacter algarum]MCO4776271.1 16S rRNA (cytosine(1402)-N(4))-methyltransferase RsmH [Lentibacter algarum]MCO4828982.1 16S rRNA (cytosine(1402)-N(4))-methyltransferase RsmH [Lentibacter algarum]WIF31317.1 S-adenosyl-L-methionine-dependent methyltransferase MraW [Lentibacter algarum]SDY22892.1 16S rRNA (cytosine1402-N4)-methyltransferase [Lentibacter algarum]
MERATSERRHIPVLLQAILDHVAPVSGVWVDGTLGAGGYAKGLLDAGAEKLIGIDRDPLAHELAGVWAADYGDRVALHQTTFSKLDEVADQVDGVVLDLGVSSMQLDLAERGFSFQGDGPLDMRMSQTGRSAKELVNELDEAQIADIIYLYGEDRASRRIAKAIVKARELAPIETTGRLAEIIQSVMPRPKPGQSHPATRSFQAIRIAVNDEFGELVAGLEAAERALKPGGLLAVVSFHSLEDRVVKRFMRLRAGEAGGGSRYAPAQVPEPATFQLINKKAIGPNAQELEDNPRSRSALLRLARRTDVPARDVSAKTVGAPQLGEGVL